MEKDVIIESVKSSNTLTEACKKAGIPGQYGNIKRYIAKFNICTKHFTQKRIEYIEKTCPVCDTKFKVSKHNKSESNKTTCSYSCSNTYYRSGPSNGRWKEDSESSYRTVCFRHHKKKCICCGEDKIVEVHHYDYNHHNNDPVNLVPLCPTHHQYIHSKHKYLIEDKVDKYVKQFKKRTRNKKL